MIVPTVISLLRSSGQVTTYVDNRVFPVRVPQGEDRNPCIIVWIGGNSPTDTNIGTSAVDDINFMIHLEGRNYEQLDALASIVRKRLESYAGGKVEKIRYITENDLSYDVDNNLFAREVIYNVRVQRNGNG